MGNSKKLWPIRAWSSGDAVSDWKLNEYAFNMEFARNPPACQAVHSTPADIDLHASWTLLSWDTAVFDNDEMLDDTRITIQTDGLYRVGVRVAFPTCVGMTYQDPSTDNDEWPHTVALALVLNEAGQFVYGQPGLLGVDVQSMGGTSLPRDVGIGARCSVVVTQRFEAGDYMEVFAARRGGSSATDYAVGGNGSTKDGSFTAVMIGR